MNYQMDAYLQERRSSAQSAFASPLVSFSAVNMRELAKAARLRLLRMHMEARVGHIGGNLSAPEAMLAGHPVPGGTPSIPFATGSLGHASRMR